MVNAQQVSWSSKGEAMKNYPHHWWSFMIAAAILFIFCLTVYVKFFRTNHNTNRSSATTASRSSQPLLSNGKRVQSIHSQLSSSAKQLLTSLRGQKAWKPATSKRASTAIINIGEYHAMKDSRYHSLVVNEESQQSQRGSSKHYGSRSGAGSGSGSPSASGSTSATGLSAARYPFSSRPRVGVRSSHRQIGDKNNRRTRSRGGNGGSSSGSDSNAAENDNQFLVEQFMHRICAPILIENQLKQQNKRRCGNRKKKSTKQKAKNNYTQKENRFLSVSGSSGDDYDDDDEEDVDIADYHFDDDERDLLLP